MHALPTSAFGASPIRVAPALWLDRLEVGTARRRRQVCHGNTGTYV